MRRPLLAVSVALLGVALANSYAPPRPLLIGSAWGGYGFKFLPQGVDQAKASAKGSTGVLVDLQADGTLKTLWKRRLVNTPSRVMISPSGHVVTLDNWAGYGSPEHALVIYDIQGKVTADLTYEGVMRGSPACPSCQSMDGPFLSWGYEKISFTSYGNEWFVIFRDAKGRGPTISLKTGQPKTSWNGKPRP